MKLIFRFHALARMFERNISAQDVIDTIKFGKVIETYSSDKPYPSCLRLGFIEGRAIHIVTADVTESNEIVILTVYEPDTNKWYSGFEKRK